MEFRTLGSTGLKVSAIGLGTWTMGGKWWGEVNDDESIAAIKKALDLGINFFDTADMYGFGRSEKVLAEALGDQRKEIILATKLGIRWNKKGKMKNDLSPQYVHQAVDASLERLQTDVIDLYQIHWPDPNTPLEATMGALNECVQAGKVRHLGVSNFTVELIEEARKFGSVETLQPQLNLFERYTEVQLLPYCFKKNIGVLGYSSLCRGLLSGRFKSGDKFDITVRKRDPLFKGEVFERNLRIIERLKEIAKGYNKTVAQLAIAWVLAHPAISVALCGARRPEQVEENIGGSNWQISTDDLYKMGQILITT